MIRSYFLFLTIFTSFLISCSNDKDDSVFQYSTLHQILIGNYDGNIDLRELKQHGDLGLGTFNGLNGEMVYVDGSFYRIDVDGNAHTPPSDTLSPFAVIAELKPDQSIYIETSMSCINLKKLINSKIESKDKIYAIKISGTFDTVITRSIDKQKKPYPDLKTAQLGEKKLRQKNVEGDMVGFRFPSYYTEINVPKYHFHFISQDKTRGGHVLSCNVSNANIYIDEKAGLNIKLN